MLFRFSVPDTVAELFNIARINLWDFAKLFKRMDSRIRASAVGWTIVQRSYPNIEWNIIIITPVLFKSLMKSISPK